MTSPLWQILVVTLTSRRHFLARLEEKLRHQLVEGVQLLTLCDDGERSIGWKRQAMLEQSTAPYVNFFDDDDLPAEDYVAQIHAVLTGSDPPDIVGFKLKYVSDGVHRGIAVHSYNARDIPIGPVHRRVSKMNRLPNHLNPVRRELALQAGFPLDRNTGEDSAFAVGLSRLRPQPREHFIDKELYVYDHRSNNRRPREEVQSTNEYRVKHGTLPAVVPV